MFWNSGSISKAFKRSTAEKNKAQLKMSAKINLSMSFQINSIDFKLRLYLSLLFHLVKIYQ